MGTKTQKLSNVVDQIVEWQSVVVADGSTNTTSVSGRGYFIDTSAGAHTVNLPASPKIGDIIKVSLITAGNTLTIGRNGNNINGNTSNITTSVDGDMFELVYVNVSEGWKTVGQISAGTFISATGGTITQSGDYQIHTFTGDGCFVVSSVGNGESNSLGGPSTVDYLVVAGGGGGGTRRGGGAGAGGYRESSGTASGCYSVSPLGACVSGITVSTTTYPVTVGAGGTGNVVPGPAQPTTQATNGVASSFSTITSTGGGFGGNNTPPTQMNGGPGGSGGGGGGQFCAQGGSGNTPPTSPSQGNNGGVGNQPPYSCGEYGGGGGGAGVIGAAGTGTNAGDGGNGVATSITGSPVTRAGGGGGGSSNGSAPTIGSGGTGGGGDGGYPGSNPGTAGTTNTGGGGGGSGAGYPTIGGNGGKGIVIIRYKYQ